MDTGVCPGLIVCGETIKAPTKTLSFTAYIVNSLQKKEAEKKALQYEFDKKQAVAKVEQEKKDAEAKKDQKPAVFYYCRIGIASVGNLFNSGNTMEKQSTKKKDKYTAAFRKGTGGIGTISTDIHAGPTHPG